MLNIPTELRDIVAAAAKTLEREELKALKDQAQKVSPLSRSDIGKLITLKRHQNEAIWAEVDSELYDPTEFPVRFGYFSVAFRSRAAAILWFEAKRDKKIADAKRVFDEAQLKYKTAETFWGGPEGLEWFMKATGLTVEQIEVAAAELEAA